MTSDLEGIWRFLEADPANQDARAALADALGDAGDGHESPLGYGVAWMHHRDCWPEFCWISGDHGVGYWYLPIDRETPVFGQKLFWDFESKTFVASVKKAAEWLWGLKVLYEELFKLGPWRDELFPKPEPVELPPGTGYAPAPRYSTPAPSVVLGRVYEQPRDGLVRFIDHNGNYMEARRRTNRPLFVNDILFLDDVEA
ncbi:MAG TPA: hypothetical protein VKE40_24075 [Gemmataceae bacterium]|nr:hypothetical protein [Gemmataceae bacterium]